MIVVVALAEGEKRHEPAVPRAATVRVGLVAKGVAGRVNEERAVLHRHHAGHPAEEEATQETLPAAHDRQAKQGGEQEAHDHADPLHVAVLPRDELVLLEVSDVAVVLVVGLELEEQPADVREEEALADRVRVVVVVDVLVVLAVFAGPHDDRVLEGRRAKEQREKLHRPLGLEGHVREQPVVAQSDAHARGVEHHHEHRHEEPRQPVGEEVRRHGGQGEGERADQKGTGHPVDFVDVEAVEDHEVGERRRRKVFGRVGRPGKTART